MPEYAIQTNERLVMVGKTGSGKTVMANHLFEGVERGVIFDGKGEISTPEGLAAWNADLWTERGAARLARGQGSRENPVRLVVPPPSLDVDAPLWEWWLPYMRAIYNARDCTLYIDELYTAVRPGSPPSSELTALYTRGRSLGVGVWSATQRPMWVPRFCLSEVEWVFTFRLLLEDDRRRMAEICGPDLMQPVPDQYGYWLYNTSWNIPPIYSSGLSLPATATAGR